MSALVELIQVVFGGAVGVPLAGLAYRQARRVWRAHQLASGELARGTFERLGLPFGPRDPRRAEGVVGGERLEVYFEPLAHEAGARLQVRVDLAGRVPDRVMVHVQRAASRRRALPPGAGVEASGRRVRTHDHRFDRRFWASGPEALVHAMLTREGRLGLSKLVDGQTHGAWERVWLRGATLHAELVIAREARNIDQENLAALIEDLVHAVAPLCFAPGEMPARLAAQLGKLQSNLYRARCVEHLLELFPGHPLTYKCLEVCRDHGVCELRLLYHQRHPKQLDEEQRYRLLRDVSVGHGDERVREWALQALAEQFEGRLVLARDAPLFQRLRLLGPCAEVMELEAFWAVVEEALGGASDPERGEFLRELAALRIQGVAGVLAQQARRLCGHPGALDALLELIDRQPDAQREALLILVLQHQRQREARRRAIAGLAECGGVDALQALIWLFGHAALQAGARASSGLAADARAAAQQLTGRLGEQVQGALTLSADAHGRGELSVVEEIGALTPVEGRGMVT